MMIVYVAYTVGKLMQEKRYCCIWSDTWVWFDGRKPGKSDGEAS